MTRSAVALARLATSPVSQAPDAELLRAFVTSHGEEAFAELVRRHGPMVLAVCRRVLSNAHDAEDAFQAAFLVLARKAGTIRGTNLAGWLYGVAVRTARGVRIMRDRRRKREQASGGCEPPVLDVPTDHDTARIIDEELAKLPDHHRDVLVVCELRGLSRKDAASELGIPEGTLSSRLAGAKRKLAARLAARGVTGTVVLGTVLAPAAVSAALEQSTALAVRGTASTVAGAAASAVLKGMLFDQLKGVVLAAGLLLTGVCGGLAMTHSPDSPPGGSAPAPAPVARAAEDPPAALVKQLTSEDFAEREAASKELRALGPKAEPALKAGLKSEDPEVRIRCEKILAEIRKDALDALVKNFDPKAESLPDHPIWKRLKLIAGDTPASRELFARVIKNAEWLRRLDAAETGPDAAGRQYREAMIDVGRHYRSGVSGGFVIYVWPCDTADQAAFLLLLGTYPGTHTAPPSSEGGSDEFAAGETRLVFARGLPLGLEGKEIAPGPQKHYDETAALTNGSDRVFAKLLAAWMARREPGANGNAMPEAFWLAARHGVKEVLPLARVVAGDKFPHDKTPAAALYGGALAVVARFGNPADLPLFERHFKNQEAVATFELEGSVPVGAKGPDRGPAQLRDVAMGLALLLHGEDPAAHGFLLGNSKRAKPGQPPDPAWYDPVNFAFLEGDDKSRAAAHAKVKAFLDTPGNVAPLPRPKPTP